MALFRYQELLSAKKEGYEVWKGLTFLIMCPQCLFIGTADTYFIDFRLLVDTNNSKINAFAEFLVFAHILAHYVVG
jgi:hypothetical protein